EDRVRNEPVEPSSAQKRPKLLARPRRVEVTPDDRVKAGVPVPLVAVPGRRRTREAVRGAVGQRAVSPVAGERAMSLGAEPVESFAVGQGGWRQRRFSSCTRASN